MDVDLGRCDNTTKANKPDILAAMPVAALASSTFSVIYRWSDDCSLPLNKALDVRSNFFYDTAEFVAKCHGGSFPIRGIGLFGH